MLTQVTGQAAKHFFKYLTGGAGVRETIFLKKGADIIITVQKIIMELVKPNSVDVVGEIYSHLLLE